MTSSESESLARAWLPAWADLQITEKASRGAKAHWQAATATEAILDNDRDFVIQKAPNPRQHEPA